MKMEAAFRDTGVRTPNKTGQIKGLRSHRTSKGNRQQAFQADTQRDSEYKYDKEKLLPGVNWLCHTARKGSRLLPGSLAALSKGLSGKQLDKYPYTSTSLSKHARNTLEKLHSNCSCLLLKHSQMFQLLAPYSLPVRESNLFSTYTHAVQKLERAFSCYSFVSPTS